VRERESVEIHTELLSAERLKLFGRPRHKWENIEEVRGDGVEWMHLSKDKVHRWVLVNQVMKVWVP
jgi:hypothetical protein